VYVVRSDHEELLLPAISDVVRSVDLEQGVLTVDLIEGLR
jgi:ribosomal 30S subunit maturation factor RimM